MDDIQSAKLLISAIINEEIIELDCKPQEREIDIEKLSITVYRLDFSAKIKVKVGTYKKVLIEIQKAKFSTDIIRFRKYLGEQYINKENIIIVKKDGVEKNVAIPIVSIYFLGHKLEYSIVPVIKVDRQYIDIATGTEIKEKEEFIESLTHTSFVIQIPFLKQKRRNELEKLLSIFDQDKTIENDHFLNIKEEDIPEKYRIIIRRLQRAAEEPKVRQTMDLEDEILGELENRERAIALRDELLIEKDKALDENKKTIEGKDKALDEKDKIIIELKKKLGEQ
jgi:hypothetical protein